MSRLPTKPTKPFRHTMQCHRFKGYLKIPASQKLASPFSGSLLGIERLSPPIISPHRRTPLAHTPIVGSIPVCGICGTGVIGFTPAQPAVLRPSCFGLWRFGRVKSCFFIPAAAERRPLCIFPVPKFGGATGAQKHRGSPYYCPHTYIVSHDSLLIRLNNQRFISRMM